MKYLKKYELISESKYKVGDYVLNRDKGNLTIGDHIKMDRRHKILKIAEPKYYIVEIYKLKTLSKIDIEMGCRENYIERILTPEEIKDFEIEKNAEKYNL